MALFAFLALWVGSASADCGLLERYPHEAFATLSNGAQVPLPTHARKLASYVLFGTLDPVGAASRLSEGFSPLKFGGRAFGALSVFDYQESDLGVFRESYFVILARQPRASRPALFHLKAWSTSETAALASHELWGIPSQQGEIDITAQGLKAVFQVRAREVPVIDMTWGESPALPNPFGYFLSVDAVGPGQGTPVTSPIRSCGSSRIGAFNSADSLVVRDRSLDVLLKALAFRPTTKVLFDNEQAVQFPGSDRGP